MNEIKSPTAEEIAKSKQAAEIVGGVGCLCLGVLIGVTWWRKWKRLYWESRGPQFCERCKAELKKDKK